jgi:DNA-binding NarL/FixJ family response regulator
MHCSIRADVSASARSGQVIFPRPAVSAGIKKQTGNAQVRVLIIDDHPLIVEAIGIAIDSLRPDVQVESLPSVESLDREQPERPDLVLLDMSLPGVSGLDALGSVIARWPETIVVIFSATDDSASIRRALSAGARGFIPKTSPHKVLIDALRLVLDGGTYIPPDILVEPSTPSAPSLSRNATPPGFEMHGSPHTGDVPQPPLSERQRQIVELLAQGMTTKEICRELGISQNTVKTHVASIFRALGVRNRAQVVAVTQAWLLRHRSH